MEIILNPHANYNASSLVLIVADLVAAFIMWQWAHAIMKERGMRCVDLFRVGPLRMMTGSVIMLLGVAAGSIMWLPAFPILAAENMSLSEWYVRIATWPANIMNMLSVVGVSIILWPVLWRKFGNWAIPAVALITACVYVIGLIGTAIFTEFFRVI